MCSALFWIRMLSLPAGMRFDPLKTRAQPMFIALNPPVAFVPLIGQADAIKVLLREMAYPELLYGERLRMSAFLPPLRLTTIPKGPGEPNAAEADASPCFNRT